MCLCEETRVDLQRQCVCVYVKDTRRIYRDRKECVCVCVKDTSRSTETGCVCV